MSHTHQLTRALVADGLAGFSLSRFLGKASSAIQRYGPAVTSIAAGVGVQMPGIIATGANLVQRAGQQFLPGGATNPQSGPVQNGPVPGAIQLQRGAMYFAFAVAAGVGLWALTRRRR